MNVFPVVRELFSDTVDAVSVFYALGLENEACCVREEIKGNYVSRFQSLYFSPYETYSIEDGKLKIARGNNIRTLEGNPIILLKECLEKNRARNLLKSVKVSPLLGYIGYDCVQYLENIALPSRPAPESEACLAFFRNAVVIDRLSSRIYLISHCFSDYESVDVANRELVQMESKLRNPCAKPPRVHLAEGASIDVVSAFDSDEFHSVIKRVKRHIRDGDIFQCVLSNRMTAKMKESPFTVYRVLRALNPSPYLYYFCAGGQSLIGSSPEALIKINDRIIETWPIAGTRPRGKTSREDIAREKDLLRSSKERAEHVMLVDLSRNDLGRVSLPGSVSVNKFMEVHRYSHVMHLVSEVTGRLRRKKTVWDAFFACFPAGTLSGAPKIRAMQIISELESVRRGAYGGAMLAYDLQGNLDSWIIIRSLLVKDGIGNFQAGAGIVADSTADREFAEISAKAGAVRRALEVCGGLS
jgi:anthranilate synthase component I